ncbi:MAG: hypothetical protein JKX85_00465 [Phycisphaeraceae bacterium]|nr:hypothetical protein [Phycisphaeraceae bacterium]
MRNKTAYLSICITLVYWLGGMVGCATSPSEARNEEMLKEDRSIFDTTPPGQRSAVSPKIELALASIQSAVKVTESADFKDASKAKTVVVTSLGDTELSLTGVDRSHWQTKTVAPKVGKAMHGYTYYADLSGRQHAHTTVDLNADPQVAMKTALDDTECQLLSQREWASALIQPLKFCWDTLMLPYNATVKEPFWVDTKKGE